MSIQTQHQRKLDSRSTAIILIIVTLLVMGRLCVSGFTNWDDNNTVYHNPRLNPPTLSSLAYYWTHPAFRIYAPLTYTAWIGLASVAQMSPNHDGITLDPMIFHGASLLCHVVAVLVVCKILLLIGLSPFAALCGSLLFAVHPVQVEPVAWVSGLKDVLSGLFSLVAMWRYLQFAIDAKQGRRRTGSLLLCIASMILAMLAKSTAAMVPLAAIAADRWIVRRSWQSIFRSAAWLVLAAAPFMVIGRVTQSVGDLAPSPEWQHVLVAMDSLAFYLRKLIWPINLCVDYGHTPWRAIHQPAIYFTWLAPAGVAITLFVLRNRAPQLLAAALIFVAATFPTLGLIPFATQFFSTTADHYLYWAMLGPAIALAWCLDAFASVALPGRMTVAIIVLLAVLSVRQGGYWKDDFALFGHAIEINPRSFASFNNLGNDFERERNLPAAAAMFRKAIDARHDFFVAYSNLGSVLKQMGRLDESTQVLQDAVAIERLQRRELRYTWIDDLNRLGQNLLDLGKPAQAAAAFKESLLAQPDQMQTEAFLALAQSEIDHPATTRSSSPASFAQPR